MKYDVVIVGAGAGGIASAASIQKQDSSLSIALVDPAESHYYQPGWTLVGAGCMPQSRTQRSMASVIPNGVVWIQLAVESFDPEQNKIRLSDNSELEYNALVVSPGLTVNYDAIEGLSETLGQNGVSCNYRFDLAPYTWECIQGLETGKAIFTQPGMPIKCAGAPQKILYLAADYWREQGRLKQIDVQFRNAGPVLFGVSEFVPILNHYMDRYQAKRHYSSNLVKVDGPNRTATFKQVDEQGNEVLVEETFDFLHAVPPQVAPEFVRQSTLSNEAGWLDVDQDTLQHVRFANVFGCGDIISAPNAKTAAAVRKQAPVVARNLVNFLKSKSVQYSYDGYGSCPLTVERGKVVLAEFGYGGKLLPSFKGLDPTKPRSLWWKLKADWLVPLYFDLMLKGREWMAGPNKKA